MAELQEMINSKRPGDKMSITFLHRKNKVNKTVTLKNAQGNTNIVKVADLDVLGGNYREITQSQKEQLRINYGLEVMKVSNGPLKEVGIAKGFIIQDVNDTPMKSLSDLQLAVKKASTSKDPVLYIKGIWPSGKRDYFAVMVNE